MPDDTRADGADTPSERSPEALTAEREAMHAALRLAEERLTTILRGRSLWLWESDESHRFTAFFGPGGLDRGAVIGRTRFAAAMMQGALRRPAEPVDVLGLARGAQRGRDPADLASFLTGLVHGQPLQPGRERALLESSGVGPDLSADAVRQLATAVLASPEAQLG